MLSPMTFQPRFIPRASPESNFEEKEISAIKDSGYGERGIEGGANKSGFVTGGVAAREDPVIYDKLLWI